MAEENPAPVAPDADAGEQDTTEGLLRQLLDEQRQHRAEVQELREQINQGRRQQAPRPSATVLSAEELAQQRADEIAQHDFYCPACGRLYDYQRECAGRPEAPHAPLDVISTDELHATDDRSHPDDPAKHTAAPGVNP